MIHNFNFMDRSVHPSDLPPGVLYMGAPGSGKTVTMLTHVRAMCTMGIPLIGVDQKGDDLPNFLRHILPPSIPLHVIDPFHMDGTAIDWSKLANTPARVDMFTRKLIPEIKGDSQPHFRNSAARQVKIAATLLNHYSKNAWKLADLIRLAKNRRLLVHLNNQTPGMEKIDTGREEQTSTKDVQSTVETALSLFEIYAALEMKCTKFVDVMSCIDLGHGNIVFLWSDEFSSVLSGVASFLIDTVTNRLLSRQADDDQLTILWLDELASLQRLDALDSIARRGRSSKIIPLVGVQTFEGVRHIYGPDLAEQMLGILPCKIFTRAATITSAKWASEYLGIPRKWEILPPLNRHMTPQQSVKDNNPIITPEELRRIPKPDLSREDSIQGYFDFPEGAGAFDISVLNQIQYPKGGQDRRRPVPDSWQVLPALTADDLLRLNFQNCIQFI